MPNWCNNTLTITGPEEILRPIWEAAIAETEDSGFLQALLPMPERLKDTTAPSPDGNNWYNWRVTNWGTKWDVSTEGLEFSSSDGFATITGFFDSAWSPPIDALCAFADAHEEVYAELYYFECGMAFVGYWDSDGSDEYYNYSDFDSKTVRNHIPEHLVDHWDLEYELQQMEEWEAENNEEAEPA